MFCMSDAPEHAGQIFFFYSEDADPPDEAIRFLAPSLSSAAPKYKGSIRL